MLIASLFAHFTLGVLLSVIFVLYYINGDGKWKLWLELLIGSGGNIGAIFILDKWLAVENAEIRMYSVGCCILAFLLGTLILLFIFSKIIKDKDDKDIIRIRDIMLGQTSWINKYYERRAAEIDKKLNISLLEKRESDITKKESSINEKENYIKQEMEKLASLGEKKLRLNLPEHASIVLTKEYIEAMPSYISNVVNCITNIDGCTKIILNKSLDQINKTTIKSYFVSLATYISCNIFGGYTQDVRIHFRIYDTDKKGYVKLVAVTGKDIVKKEMTVIPYAEDSMIKKSYECRRALIMSINSDHDYKSNNHFVWQVYMTYTIYDINIDDTPVFSFGISVKNAARYKTMLQFLNYFRIEDFLQNDIEQIDEYVGLVNIFYGGAVND